jgi:hypothetical protein
MKKEFAVTLFKLLSIYAFIEALSIVAYNFPYPFWVNSSDDKFLMVVQAAASAMLLIIFSLILWWRSGSLAAHIFKSDTADEFKSITPSEIHVVAFSSVGLFLLCESFPNIVKLIIYHYQINVATKGYPGLQADPVFIAEKYGSFAFTIIQTLIGAWLLFGSSGIVKLIRATRGKSEEEQK